MRNACPKSKYWAKNDHDVHSFLPSLIPFLPYPSPLPSNSPSSLRHSPSLLLHLTNQNALHSQPLSLTCNVPHYVLIGQQKAAPNPEHCPCARPPSVRLPAHYDAHRSAVAKELSQELFFHSRVGFVDISHKLDASLVVLLQVFGELQQCIFVLGVEGRFYIKKTRIFFECDDQCSTIWTLCIRQSPHSHLHTHSMICIVPAQPRLKIRLSHLRILPNRMTSTD